MAAVTRTNDLDRHWWCRRSVIALWDSQRGRRELALSEMMRPDHYPGLPGVGTGPFAPAPPRRIIAEAARVVLFELEGSALTSTDALA